MTTEDTGGNRQQGLATIGYLSYADWAFTSVHPNYFSVLNPHQDALMVMAGADPWYKVETMAYVVGFGGMGIFLLLRAAIALWRRSRSATTTLPPTATDGVENPAPEATDQTPEAIDQTPQATGPMPEAKGTGSGWGTLIFVIASAAIFLGGPWAIDWWRSAPPICGHAAVRVELFVDGCSGQPA